MSIDVSQFLGTFYEESFEGLDAMESGLLNLDVGAADVEIINTIFRAAHSIKGGAATFGLNEVADFTHVLETLLDEMRDGRRQVTQGAVDKLLRSVDCLRDMLTAAGQGETVEQHRIQELQVELNQLLKEGTDAPEGQPDDLVRPDDSAQPDDPVRPNDPVQAEGGGWHINFRPHADILCRGNDPVRILRELEELTTPDHPVASDHPGELTVNVDVSRVPQFSQLNPEQCFLAWDITLLTDVSYQQVAEIFDWVIDESDLDITPLTSTPEQMPTAQAGANNQSESRQSDDLHRIIRSAQPEQPDDPGRKADRSRMIRSKIGKPGGEMASIRVAIDKVDALVNMVGELVITQSMLSQLGQDFDMSRLEGLTDGLAQLDRNTRELQESVMRIRMLPISFTFQRFPRIVHDLSQKLHKKIELKMSGEQTELDKTVMEKIGDPLMHLVRNALDHGIESPAERVAAGKPETGQINLSAYHQGGNIVIKISDDGAGLDKERIFAKAKAQGLVSDDDQLTDEKVFELIFQPGFSTATEVSDVSGRGVGMDVVRRNVRELAGNIDVASEPGKGSTFTIRLPLTLAILDGQLVRVGAETYIIPLVSIVESLQIKQQCINGIAGRAESYSLRGEYIPVIRLYDLFGIKPDTETLADGLLVVVEGEGQRVGIFVDDLLSQQQVVIKSLETNYKKIVGVSGATILGDGTVALILDIGGVIDYSRSSGNKYSRMVAQSISEAA